MVFQFSISVPDQAGTKMISKGGWTILELFRSQIGSFHSQSDQDRVFTRGRNLFTSSRRLSKKFGKETALMNLCNVNGEVPDLKRHDPTQRE